MKLLVIGDDPDDRALLIRLLRRRYPRATFEEIGSEEAFRATLARGDFQVVVTGYRLRWADGLWVLRKVRELDPYIPVVMVGGVEDEEAVVAGMKAGLNDYVPRRQLRRLPRAVWESLREARRRREEATQAERALKRRDTRLQLLRRLDRAILEAQAPEEIAYTALEWLSQWVRWEWGGVALFDFEVEQIEWVTVYPPEEEARPPMAIWAPPFADALDELRRGELWVVEDLAAISEDVGLLNELFDRGLRSLVLVPLRCRDGLIGSLSLAMAETGGLPQEEAEILREVSDRLSVALYQDRLYEQLRHGRERLRLLSRRLAEGQEAERRRIARELHDEVGQSLTGLKLTLQALQRSCDEPELRRCLQEALGTVDRVLDQTRGLSMALRPLILDDLGLVPALRWHVDRVAQQAGFVAHFAADPFETRLPSALETACFRVAQEALTNVVRHAQARRVYVEVRRRGGELRLVVRDDGIGFDVEAVLRQAAHGASLGLMSMEERVRLIGGRLKIESVMGKGTEVRAVFPISPSAFQEEPAL